MAIEVNRRYLANMAETIVLGTRGSDLALIQARMFQKALREHWADVAVQIKTIRTRGDQRQQQRKGNFGLADIRAGRKGLFTGEIERELAEGKIDVAVHSAKDLPSVLLPGTQIGAVLPRAPAGDVLVSQGDYDLHSLPRDGIVATGSVRRQHQLRWKRSDLEIVDLKGNVPTRLRKMAVGEWHGAILAEAGLERLGLMNQDGELSYEGNPFFAQRLPGEIFLAAGGQGIIAAQIRAGNDRVRMLIEPINHFETRLCLRVEREFLRLMHGDCNQPVGVFATMHGDKLKARAQLFHLQATVPREANAEGPVGEPEQLAARLWEQINVP